jgi:hypothetical protein
VKRLFFEYYQSLRPFVDLGTGFQGDFSPGR